MYHCAVKLNFKAFVSAMLATLLLAAYVSTQNTGARGHSYGSVSQTSVDCTEPAFPEDATGRMRRTRVDVGPCRESLRRSDAPKPAVNGQRTGLVNVTEIGPVGGGSFSNAGFIFNGKDTRQIVLPGSRLFRSVNGGHDWSPITPISIYGGAAGQPGQVGQDPQNPQVLLAAMDDGLVYRSEDFGTTWSPLEASYDNSLGGFAFNEASSNVILFFDGGTFWRSNDGGATVEYQPNTGLPTPQFDPETGDFIYPNYTDFETTPADPNTVYVVLSNDLGSFYAPGIFKSIDFGQTFVRLAGSSPSPSQVFPHPTDPNVLYVKDDFLGLEYLPRIFRSLDGGSTFDLVTTGLPEDLFFTLVTFDAQNPSYVYFTGVAGIFRSTDNGISFQRLGLTAEQVGVGATTASVSPTNPNVLYVNTSRGNFRSANGGITFQSISNGWRSVFINHMGFDNDSEPSLYVAAQQGLGILKTRTRGKHYEQIPHPIDPFEPFARVRRLGISPINPDVIFAGTIDRGLFRTTNGGRTWTQSSVDTGNEEFHQTRTQIGIDPINPNNVYFVSSGGFFSLGVPGFYRSSDGGSTFQRTSSQPSDVMGIDPVNSGVIYAGGRGFLSSNFRPLKSVDGGLSFSNGPIYQALVSTIVIDPINPNNLYLAGDFLLTERIFEPHVVVRSTDGGVTYSAADEGLPYFVYDLVIDPQDPGRLFAWTIDGLFISTDHAASWTLLEGADAFKTAGFLDKLTINPKRPSLLYLMGSTVVEVEIK